MADNDQCRGVGQQSRFQRLKGFHIQIIGRFVEDQQIRGLDQQLGENDTVSLTAGQGRHPSHGAFRREQEVGEIADDVLLAPLNVDVVATLADDLRHCP